VALPAFAAAAPAVQQSIENSPAGPTAADSPRRTLLHRASGTDVQSDRRTDTVSFHRPCSVYYAVVKTKAVCSKVGVETDGRTVTTNRITLPANAVGNKYPAVQLLIGLHVYIV